MATRGDQTIAVFDIKSGSGAKRFLKSIQRIDKENDEVKILDAAIAQRTRLGRVKIHQTEDTGALKGGIRGGTIGLVAGGILLGPVGAVVGGVGGGVLAGLHNRFRDIGIDDKFMKEIGKVVDKGDRALFVLYEGKWEASIGQIQDLIKAEKAMLIHSTISAEKAAQLQTVITGAAEELGGEEAVADFEIAAPAEEAAPAEPPKAAAKQDDLTMLKGIGPKTAAALSGAGIASYASLARTSEPDLRHALTKADTTVPGNVDTWAMQASFAERGDWPGLYAFLKTQEGPSRPHAASKAKAKPDDLTQLVGVGPKAEAALAAAGYETYDSLADANEPQIRAALHTADIVPPGNVNTWPMQAAYAAKGDWQGLMKYNKKRAGKTTSKSKSSAKKAAASNAKPDDLTRIKGVGPRMAMILADGGISTYDELQHASTGRLREVVAVGGALPPSSLSTWPTQAAFAAKDDWKGLSDYNQRH